MLNALILTLITLIVVFLAERTRKLRLLAFVLLAASLVAWMYVGGLWR